MLVGDRASPPGDEQRGYVGPAGRCGEKNPLPSAGSRFQPSSSALIVHSLKSVVLFLIQPVLPSSRIKNS